MRSKKALLNMLASIAGELTAVICGLILPRLILGAFGSSYNGITSSITQFLSCVTLLRAGVGGVTRAALYKPLAEQNTREISAIVNATSRFMQRVALIFAGSIVVFACVYPFLVRDEFEWFFAFSLVLILGISTFCQYYFGITYQELLKADQRQHVISVIQIVTTVLNTVLAAILIKLGAGIHAVKLGSAVAFSLNPLLTNWYVKRLYALDTHAAPNNEAIRQRWDAFWQSVAYFAHNNTDIMVLTCFTNTLEVSVYTVYNYVIANIRNVIINFIPGFGAAFGNMLAKGEHETALRNLRIYELIVFDLTAVIYTTTGFLIVPFALLYTAGVTDVEYARPLYALLATVAGAFSCFRIPYQTIVEAAGHFKQTRNGAFLEAGLNILISIVGAIRFGLVGVAIGTLVATVFRSVQYSHYLSKHLLPRSPWIFWRHILTNAAITGATTLIYTRFLSFETATVGLWVLKAAALTLCTTALTAAASLIFYGKDTVYLLKKLRGMLSKRRKPRRTP